MNQEPDFFLIPTLVKKTKGLRPSDWFVYATIYWYEHMAGNICYASNASIARASGMGERTVGLALEHLERAGLIERLFTDKDKTKRTQIHARVFFSVTPSLFGEGSTGVPPRGVEQACEGGSTGVPQSIKNRKVINTNTSDAGASRESIERFFSLFRGMNPSYQKFFSNKTQAASAKRLLAMNDHDFWASFLAKYAVQMRIDKFCPRATTPWQLEEKLGLIQAYTSSGKAEQLTGNKRGRGFVV
jgi:hypothetical protein